MRSLVFAVAFLGLAACQTVPDSHFNPVSFEYNTLYHTVFPESVAILQRDPDVDYNILGTVTVDAYQHEPSTTRIKALQQEAALYGAHAIILHDNMPDCLRYTDIGNCQGNGDDISATAIRYNRPNEVAAMLLDPVTPYNDSLETGINTSYDEVEFFDYYQQR